MRGTERLAWSQAGHVSGLRFLAYVDDVPVLLDGAECDAATPEASCSSPLPPMADGRHVIAVASALGSGPESDRSLSLLVEKISGSTSSMPLLQEAATGLQALVQLAPGFAFDVDVVAREIRGPAQMVLTPDSRLLIAEADGRMRVLRPDEASREGLALDGGQTRRMLGGTGHGSPGLALDPDFSRNPFIYLAMLIDDGGRQILRVVRLREVGDTLGDPVSLFETSVAGRVPVGHTIDGRALNPEGPRMAFGPDGLLYVALPAGIVFDREPAASRPHPSMLRLRRDGLVSDVSPVTGVRAHPLSFTWDPSTGALWLAFAERGVTTLEPAAAALVPRADRRLAIERLQLTSTLRRLPGGRALVIEDTGHLQTHYLTRSLLNAPATASTVRLTMPVAGDGVADMLGDIVSSADGTWFVMLRTGGEDGDTVVRLRKTNR